MNLILRDGPIVESDELSEGLIVDYGRAGRIISIEILDASEHVSEPRDVIYELKEIKAAI